MGDNNPNSVATQINTGFILNMNDNIISYLTFVDPPYRAFAVIAFRKWKPILKAFL